MENEYVIISKTAILKRIEELNKPIAHHDGIYISDSQLAKQDILEEILSQSTPLIPELQKTWNAAYTDALSIDEETYKPLFFKDYISNLKFDI